MHSSKWVAKLAVNLRQVHAWVLWAGDPALAAGRAVPAPGRAAQETAALGSAPRLSALLFCSSLGFFTSVTTKHRHRD